MGTRLQWGFCSDPGRPHVPDPADGGRRDREAAQQPPVAGSSRRVRHAQAPPRGSAPSDPALRQAQRPAAPRRGPKLRKLSHNWQILTGRSGNRGCGDFREFKANKPREKAGGGERAASCSGGEARRSGWAARRGSGSAGDCAATKDFRCRTAAPAAPH